MSGAYRPKTPLLVSHWDKLSLGGLCICGTVLGVRVVRDRMVGDVIGSEVIPHRCAPSGAQGPSAEEVARNADSGAHRWGLLHSERWEGRNG